MKIYFLLTPICFFLMNCASDPKALSQEAEMEKELIEPIDKKISYSDTTHSFSDIGDYYSESPYSEDSLISINGKNYQLKIWSKLDQNQRVLLNDCYPDGNVLECYSDVGYQGYYSISLHDGQKTVFHLDLTKDDFKDTMGSLAILSDAFLPEFIEYNAAFNSLIFQVPFNADGTCWARQLLLVVGLNGKVKFMDQLAGSGSNSTNYDVQITPDGAHLVSFGTIHSVHGKSLSFFEEDEQLLGVDVFDDCLLVVYDNDDIPTKKAFLKDYKGNTLLNFGFDGLEDGLGYAFLHEKVKNAYYFLDQHNKRLVKVQKQNAKWKATHLPFSKMKEFDGIQKSTETLINLGAYPNEFIFYVAPNSQTVRRIRLED